jgi:hypothetical protein
MPTSVPSAIAADIARCASYRTQQGRPRAETKIHRLAVSMQNVLHDDSRHVGDGCVAVRCPLWTWGASCCETAREKVLCVIANAAHRAGYSFVWDGTCSRRPRNELCNRCSLSLRDGARDSPIPLWPRMFENEGLQPFTRHDHPV